MAKKVYEKPTCELLHIAMDICTLSENDGVGFDVKSIWWTTNTFDGGEQQ